MELVYMWIESYRCFKNKGINFSNDYEVIYDGFELIIKNKQNLPLNFFGEKIKNIVGIVGGNGSGKSSLLELISIHGEARKEEAGNHFFVYYDSSLKKFSVEFYQTNNKLMLKKYEKSKYFIDLVGYLNLDINGLAIPAQFVGPFNKLNICRIKSKIKKRVYQSNTKFSRRNSLKYNYISNFNLFKMLIELKEIKEFEDLGKVRVNDTIVEIKKIESNDFFREKEIRVHIAYAVINKFSKYILKEKLKLYTNKDYNEIDYTSKILNDLIRFLDSIGFSTYNLEREFSKSYYDSDYNIEKESFLKRIEFSLNEILINNLMNNNISLKDVVRRIRDLLLENTQIKKKELKDLENLLYLTSEIELILNSTHVEWRNDYQMIIHDQFIGFELSEILKKNQYLKDVFTIETSSFSDGEETILAFFYTLKKAILGKKGSILLLLDEVELYFHPEWCRVFISRLVAYLEKYTDTKIYIILSTHSPFILSDIPKSNLIFMGENSSLEECFATNIHELLKKGFFMKATVGEFAKEKIKWILKEFEKNIEEIDRENIFKTISLIGEGFIKKKLNALYNNKFKITEEEKLKKKLLTMTPEQQKIIKKIIENGEI